MRERHSPIGKLNATDCARPLKPRLHQLEVGNRKENSRCSDWVRSSRIRRKSGQLSNLRFSTILNFALQCSELKLYCTYSFWEWDYSRQYCRERFAVLYRQNASAKRREKRLRARNASVSRTRNRCSSCSATWRIWRPTCSESVAPVRLSAHKWRENEPLQHRQLRRLRPRRRRRQLQVLQQQCSQRQEEERRAAAVCPILRDSRSVARRLRVLQSLSKWSGVSHRHWRRTRSSGALCKQLGKNHDSNFNRLLCHTLKNCHYVMISHI